MSTLEQLNLLLPEEIQHQLLLSAVREALNRYSIISEHWSNCAALITMERSGEMTLAERLLDAVPQDGCSWLRDELWDNRDSVFECAWGDSGEEWLGAIIGPPEGDEAQAVALEGGIEFVFETSDGIPGWSDRKPPSIQELVDFIRNWRISLLTRLSRRIPLDDSPNSFPAV